MPRGRRSRGAFTTVPLLMVLAVASGCALLDGEPDQEAAADRLAAQLAAGEVADAFGDQAAEEYEAIVAGLGDATPEVSVQEVAAGDDGGLRGRHAALDLAAGGGRLVLRRRRGAAARGGRLAARVGARCRRALAGGRGGPGGGGDRGRAGTGARAGWPGHRR